MSAERQRLTAMAPGGGCSCKLPAAELEALLADAYGDREAPAPAWPGAALVCGLEWGDDAAVVAVSADQAVVHTADFFTPVVDDPFAWGRIAAANALSDVYAMGAVPLCAVNLMAWPSQLSQTVAAEVLVGGRSATDEAGCLLAGGHTIVDDTPKYGLAVTGLVHPDRVLRNDRARAGQPITLTKPIGVGVLNNLHKRTGAPIDEAVAVMGALNRDAATAAVAAGLRAATDVTGFGLLGHLYKMARASGLTAVVEAAAVPVLDGVWDGVRRGFVPGGTRRNLAWVRPELSSPCSEDQLLVLADAQTSGGLLVAGELPGYPVVGTFDAPGDFTLVVR